MAAASGSRTLMFLAGAVGFGIVAALLSVAYLKSREEAIRRSLAGTEQEMVTVVVAKEDLQKGQKIDPGYFAARNIPSTFVHPNAISPNDFERYFGRFLVEDLGRGKPLLVNFMNETFPVDFSDLIDQGRRAMTIQVDEIQSFSGQLRPGNRIDIYVNIATQLAGYDEGAKPAQADTALQEAALQEAAAQGVAISDEIKQLIQTRTAKKPADVILPVLQGVRVLATGREAYDEHLDGLSYPQRRSELNFTSITVDVTPKQAALLAIADDKGDLVAVLRNRNDQEAAPFTGVTPFDLYSNAREMKQRESLRQAAEAAGATIDENGNWVTPEGTVIKKDDIVVTENGSVVSSTGKLLSADQAMTAAGYSKNENGDYVDASGNVVKKEDVKLLANGTLMTTDGKVLSGDKVEVNKQGFIIAEDGTVMSADGKVLSGVVVNEKGEVVTPDGKVLTDANLAVAADGTVRDSSGNIIAGVSGSSLPPAFDAEETVIPGQLTTITTLQDFISLIIGGSSKDGVAKTSRVRVEPLNQEPIPVSE